MIFFFLYILLLSLLSFCPFAPGFCLASKGIDFTAPYILIFCRGSRLLPWPKPKGRKWVCASFFGGNPKVSLCFPFKTTTKQLQKENRKGLTNLFIFVREQISMCQDLGTRIHHPNPLKWVTSHCMPQAFAYSHGFRMLLPPAFLTMALWPVVFTRMRGGGEEEGRAKPGHSAALVVFSASPSWVA